VGAEIRIGDGTCVFCEYSYRPLAPATSLRGMVKPHKRGEETEDRHDHEPDDPDPLWRVIDVEEQIDPFSHRLTLLA
jgi:hypothetical protein